MSPLWGLIQEYIDVFYNNVTPMGALNALIVVIECRLLVKALSIF
jgi:hypothetical protein